MSKRATRGKSKKAIAALSHEGASRRNIPTAEYEPVLEEGDKSPVPVSFERRNRDLDPQLMWRGKDEQDWTDLVVHAHPLYIQEKVHPKVLVDELRRQTEQAEAGEQPGGHVEDLFADFNGLPDGAAKTEFYQHDANWSNRMILGDSLQVMASLAEREGLRGKVQCIYLDPPYGIKFNSNFQWSTTSRDVKDGTAKHITREPEQVKAFRDTWRDGIHSYLSYLRDRLMAARDLLAETGSIFVQIGDENVHRVRAVMDEVFGDDNFIAIISYVKTSGKAGRMLDNVTDYIIWYAKDKEHVKYRQGYVPKVLGMEGTTQYIWAKFDDGIERRLTAAELARPESIAHGVEVYAVDNLTAQSANNTTTFEYQFNGKVFSLGKGGWKTNLDGMKKLEEAGRLKAIGNTLMYRRLLDDFPVSPTSNVWRDVLMTGFSEPKVYVVQSSSKAIQRCILMSSDPGDLVLDPTCGSGTTAYVAEQWGRRWITIDTSRVALALARSRIMGARYPYYLLADSEAGIRKEAELAHTYPPPPPAKSTTGNIRHGFVYERVPHITLRSIANNAEIDVIWEQHQETLEPLREHLNKALKQSWQEWEIPRVAEESWPAQAKEAHKAWWDGRIARQVAIDASIAAKADFEYLYDKPFDDGKKVRVAGPFTVESLAPHRALTVDADDELIDRAADIQGRYDLPSEGQNFPQMILENLKIAGVQQAHKDGKIDFIALREWPGNLVCAEGLYVETTQANKRAGIFIGPEFGTVSRPDLVGAAREAAEAGFDVLIACAFNYDARSTDFDKLGKVPILKARMNADLHMADDLKNTGKGNLFVVFGEPDIKILDAEGGQIQVKINGVDVFHPNTGEVRSDGADGIACWFIDTDYNEESFFVRHAYFLGANDPYKSLKTTLKAEINREAWETLHSDTSRPFAKPKNGRIAVKVINHLGDEVMKVYRV